MGNTWGVARPPPLSFLSLRNEWAVRAIAPTPPWASAFVIAWIVAIVAIVGAGSAGNLAKVGGIVFVAALLHDGFGLLLDHLAARFPGLAARLAKTLLVIAQQEWSDYAPTMTSNVKGPAGPLSNPNDADTTATTRLAVAVDALVAAMVTTPWPTTAEQHAKWAAAVGLPTSGVVDHQMNDWSPNASHWAAPGHPWNLSWRFFRDEFAGVSLVPALGLAPDELLTFARVLRFRFDARWEAAERLDAIPPLTGFASFWLPGECMVELYWHAPQVDPRGWAHSGTVQLAVTHHARAQAQDVEDKKRSARGVERFHTQYGGLI